MPWTHDLEALEERFRRRLFVLYIVGITILLVVVGAVQSYNVQRERSRQVFQMQITNVCYTTRNNVINQNAVIEKLIAAVQASSQYSEPEKTLRVQSYRALKGEVPTCPPR